MTTPQWALLAEASVHPDLGDILTDQAALDARRAVVPSEASLDAALKRSRRHLTRVVPETAVTQAPKHSPAVTPPLEVALLQLTCATVASASVAVHEATLRGLDTLCHAAAADELGGGVAPVLGYLAHVAQHVPPLADAAWRLQLRLVLAQRRGPPLWRLLSGTALTTEPTSAQLDGGTSVAHSALHPVWFEVLHPAWHHVALPKPIIGGEPCLGPGDELHVFTRHFSVAVDTADVPGLSRPDWPQPEARARAQPLTLSAAGQAFSAVGFVDGAAMGVVLHSGQLVVTPLHGAGKIRTVPVGASAASKVLRPFASACGPCAAALVLPPLAAAPVLHWVPLSSGPSREVPLWRPPVVRPTSAFLFSRAASLSLATLRPVAAAPFLSKFLQGAPFTVELHVRVGCLADPAVVYWHGHRDIAEVFIELSAHGDAVVVRGGHRTPRTGTAAAVIQRPGLHTVLHQWLHIALVWDGSQWQLAVNGESATARGHAAASPTVDGRTLGWVVAKSLVGHVAHVRVWSRARAVTACVRDAARPAAGPGLVVSMPLRDGHGRLVLDHGPHALHSVVPEGASCGWVDDPSLAVGAATAAVERIPELIVHGQGPLAAASNGVVVAVSTAVEGRTLLREYCAYSGRLLCERDLVVAVGDDLTIDFTADGRTVVLATLAASDPLQLRLCCIPAALCADDAGIAAVPDDGTCHSSHGRHLLLDRAAEQCARWLRLCDHPVRTVAAQLLSAAPPVLAHTAGADVFDLLDAVQATSGEVSSRLLPLLAATFRIVADEFRPVAVPAALSGAAPAARLTALQRRLLAVLPPLIEHDRGSPAVADALRTALPLLVPELELPRLVFDLSRHTGRAPFLDAVLAQGLEIFSTPAASEHFLSLCDGDPGPLRPLLHVLIAQDRKLCIDCLTLGPSKHSPPKAPGFLVHVLEPALRTLFATAVASPSSRFEAEAVAVAAKVVRAASHVIHTAVGAVRQGRAREVSWAVVDSFVGRLLVPTVELLHLSAAREGLSPPALEALLKVRAALAAFQDTLLAMRSREPLLVALLPWARQALRATAAAATALACALIRPANQAETTVIDSRLFLRGTRRPGCPQDLLVKSVLQGTAASARSLTEWQAQRPSHGFAPGSQLCVVERYLYAGLASVTNSLGDPTTHATQRSILTRLEGLRSWLLFTRQSSPEMLAEVKARALLLCSLEAAVYDRHAVAAVASKAPQRRFIDGTAGARDSRAWRQMFTMWKALKKIKALMGVPPPPHDDPVAAAIQAAVAFLQAETAASAVAAAIAHRSQLATRRLLGMRSVRDLVFAHPETAASVARTLGGWHFLDAVAGAASDAVSRIRGAFAQLLTAVTVRCGALDAPEALERLFAGLHGGAWTADDFHQWPIDASLHVLVRMALRRPSPAVPSGPRGSVSGLPPSVEAATVTLAAPSVTTSTDGLSLRLAAGRGTAMGSVTWRQHAPLPTAAVPLVYYFEVCIVDLSPGASVTLGVGAPGSSLTRAPGFDAMSVALRSDDAMLFAESSVGRPLDLSALVVGDTFGCGVVTATREVFFARNGAVHTVRVPGYVYDCCPLIGLEGPAVAVRCNFGSRPFLLDLPRHFDAPQPPPRPVASLALDALGNMALRLARAIRGSPEAVRPVQLWAAFNRWLAQSLSGLLGAAAPVSERDTAVTDVLRVASMLASCRPACCVDEVQAAGSDVLRQGLLAAQPSRCDAVHAALWATCGKLCDVVPYAALHLEPGAPDVMSWLVAAAAETVPLAYQPSPHGQSVGSAAAHSALLLLRRLLSAADPEPPLGAWCTVARAAFSRALSLGADKIVPFIAALGGVGPPIIVGQHVTLHPPPDDRGGAVWVVVAVPPRRDGCVEVVPLERRGNLRSRFVSVSNVRPTVEDPPVVPQHPTLGEVLTAVTPLLLRSLPPTTYSAALTAAALTRYLHRITVAGVALEAIGGVTHLLAALAQHLAEPPQTDALLDPEAAESQLSLLYVRLSEAPPCDRPALEETAAGGREAPSPQAASPPPMALTSPEGPDAARLRMARELSLRGYSLEMCAAALEEAHYSRAEALRLLSDHVEPWMHYDDAEDGDGDPGHEGAEEEEAEEGEEHPDATESASSVSTDSGNTFRGVTFDRGVLRFTTRPLSRAGADTFAAEWTLDVWVRPGFVDVDQVILCRGVTTARHFSVGIFNHHLCVAFCDGPSQLECCGFPLSSADLRQWLRVTCACDGAQLHLSVNEAPPVSVVLPGSSRLEAPHQWSVGGHHNGTACLRGALRDLRVWAAALPVHRVEEFAAALPLIADCRFDEGYPPVVNLAAQNDLAEVHFDVVGKLEWLGCGTPRESECVPSVEVDLSTQLEPDGLFDVGAAPEAADRAGLWRAAADFSVDQASVAATEAAVPLIRHWLMSLMCLLLAHPACPPLALFGGPRALASLIRRVLEVCPHSAVAAVVQRLPAHLRHLPGSQRVEAAAAILQEGLALAVSPSPPATFESAHPTKPLHEPPREVSAPGARSFEVHFDRHMNSANPAQLAFYTDTSLARMCARALGPLYPPLRLNLPRFCFDVRVDGPGPQWGYRVVFLPDVERTLGATLLIGALIETALADPHVAAAVFRHTTLQMLLRAVRINVARPRRAAMALCAQLFRAAQHFPPSERVLRLSSLVDLRRIFEKQFRRESTHACRSKFVCACADFFSAAKDCAARWAPAEAALSRVERYHAFRHDLQEAYRSRSDADRERVLLERGRYAESIKTECNIDRTWTVWAECTGATVACTAALPQGTWYFEVKLLTGGEVAMGVVDERFDRQHEIIGVHPHSWARTLTHRSTALNRPLKAKDIIGVVVDVDRRVCQLHHNGALLVAFDFGVTEAAGPESLRRSSAFTPAMMLSTEEGVSVNFGSAHFEFEPPDGALPLDRTHLDLGALVPLNHLRAFHEVVSCLAAGRPLPPFFAADGNPFAALHGTRLGPPQVRLVASPALGLAAAPTEVRNVGRQFASCTTDCTVTGGSWYYEVTLQSQGLMQIGWAVPTSFAPDPSRGSGVGDDPHSCGLDLFRRVVWANGAALPTTVGRRWAVGDVVGCGVDFSSRRIVFSVNGNTVAVVSPADHGVEITKGLTPAASLRAGNALHFNLGASPLRAKPEGYRALSVADSWTERLDAYYATLRPADLAEWDGLAAPSRVPGRSTPTAVVSLVDALMKQGERTLHQVDLARTPQNQDLWAQCAPAEDEEAVAEWHRRLLLFDRLARAAVPLLDVSGGVASTTLDLARPFMFAATREVLANDLIRETSAKGEDLRLTLNRAAAVKARQSASPQKTLFGQTFSVLRSQHPRLFRTTQRFWSVAFLGEGAEDVGGPFREHVSDMCAELLSPALGLFVPSQNNVQSVGPCQDGFVPVPAATTAGHLEMYHFVGCLMGGALRCAEPLNLCFPPLFWDMLVNGASDNLASSDYLCSQFVQELRDFAARGPDAAEAFNDAFATEVFATTLSDGTTAALCDGGADVPVCFDRCLEYADAIVRARSDEAAAAYRALRAGLTAVIPDVALRLLGPAAVELRVCGRPDFDVAELQTGVALEGLVADDRRVLFLWDALRDFAPAERRLFLKFVSGRERMPVRLRVLPLAVQGDPDAVLPRAATCFFALELPDYSTAAVLRRKLLFAITNCVEIDTDFRARDFDENDGPQLLGETRRDSLGDDASPHSDGE